MEIQVPRSLATSKVPTALLDFWRTVMLIAEFGLIQEEEDFRDLWMVEGVSGEHFFFCSMSKSLPMELEGDGRGEKGGEMYDMGAFPFESA